jgi:hypothetical protein
LKKPGKWLNEVSQSFCPDMRVRSWSSICILVDLPCN